MTTPLPTVPNFLQGFGPQQADMYSLWTGPLTFFQDRVVLRVSQTTSATTLPSAGTLTTIAFDNVIEDPYSGWSAVNHNWTAPTGLSGWYQVTLTVWASTGVANTILVPAVNLTGTSGFSGDLADIVIPASAAGAEGTFYVYMTGGTDTVAGQAKIVNSAGNATTSLTAGQNSHMEIVWLAG